LSLDQARREQEINKQMVAKTSAQISKLKSDEQVLMQTNHQLTQQVSAINQQLSEANKENKGIKQQMATMTNQLEQLKQLAASTLGTTTTQSNKLDGEY
jgi:predicted  nucleic acid-binding Zn-ribbon protein